MSEKQDDDLWLQEELGKAEQDAERDEHARRLKFNVLVPRAVARAMAARMDSTERTLEELVSLSGFSFEVLDATYRAEEGGLSGLSDLAVLASALQSELRIEFVPLDADPLDESYTTVDAENPVDFPVPVSDAC